MKTNHLMLKELLEKYHPKERGWLSADECEMVRQTLHLDEMDVLALRNLRDYTVLSMGRSNNLEDCDRMSAITCCIDHAITGLDGEV